VEHTYIPLGIHTTVHLGFPAGGVCTHWPADGAPHEIITFTFVPRGKAPFSCAMESSGGQGPVEEGVLLGSPRAPRAELRLVHRGESGNEATFGDLSWALRFQAELAGN